MAGQPKTRARKAAVAEYVLSHALDDEQDPIDWLVDYVASGGTLVKLASEVTADAIKRKLFKKTDDPVRRHHVQRYIEGLGEAASATIAHARVSYGGHALAEETVAIADSATDAQLGKLKTDNRKYVAGVFNPALKEGGKQVNVSISMGQEHLAALRRRQQARAQVSEPEQQPNLLPSQVVDAEVVS
jgi:hypothetical protein